MVRWYTPTVKKFTVGKMSTDTSLTIAGAVVDVMTIDSIGAATLTGSWTATDFIKSSDARLKTNLKEIENPLEKVAKLTGYTYDKELPLGGGLSRSWLDRSGYSESTSRGC